MPQTNRQAKDPRRCRPPSWQGKTWFSPCPKRSPPTEIKSPPNQPRGSLGTRTIAQPGRCWALELPPFFCSCSSFFFSPRRPVGAHCLLAGPNPPPAQRRAVVAGPPTEKFWPALTARSKQNPRERCTETTPPQNPQTEYAGFRGPCGAPKNNGAPGGFPGAPNAWRARARGPPRKNKQLVQAVFANNGGVGARKSGGDGTAADRTPPERRRAEKIGGPCQGGQDPGAGAACPSGRGFPWWPAPPNGPGP